MNRMQLEDYISDIYSTKPDFPWEDDRVSAVFRHANNRKWFAIAMRVPREKLGLSGGGNIDSANFKCDPTMLGSMLTEQGLFPAYHMSKTHWITVALDGSASDGTIKMLLDISYNMTAAKRKTSKS